MTYGVFIIIDRETGPFLPDFWLAYSTREKAEAGSVAIEEFCEWAGDATRHACVYPLTDDERKELGEELSARVDAMAREKGWVGR